MTRLKKEDIEKIGNELKAYDLELKEKARLTLKEIACLAADISVEEASFKTKSNKIGIVPFEIGEGIIPFFAESIKSIVTYLGFKALITTKRNIIGIEEAVLNGCNILFMADDSKFIALNVERKLVVDNNKATAKGFVMALEAMAGGLKNKEVLVLGAGVVGKKIIAFLKERGAQVSVFDVNVEKLAELRGEKIKIEENLKEALHDYRYIIDATPQEGFIKLRDLQEEVKLVCPGVPLGIASEDYPFLKEKSIHDPLQIGVATMLMMALS